MKTTKNAIIKFAVPALIFFVLSLSFSPSALAREAPIKASLAQLKIAAETPEKGLLVDLVKRWGQLTDTNIKIGVYPFKRSLLNAEKGLADFHFPYIRNPHLNEEQLPFDYSTSEIYKVHFVLYTTADSTITPETAAQHKIGTGPGHEMFFDFPVEIENNVTQALMKLKAGRLAGYIFAAVEVDPEIKALQIAGLRRQLFQTYAVHAVLPKGAKGGRADRMITEAMNKLKASGEWDRDWAHYWPPYSP